MENRVGCHSAGVFKCTIIIVQAVTFATATFLDPSTLSPPFSYNFLSELHAAETVSEAVAVSSDNTDGFIVVGNIQVGKNGPPSAVLDTPGDSLGNLDIFAARVAANGSLEWIRRMGTPLVDWATGVTVDNSSNVYITGQVSGRLNDGGTGAVIIKLNVTGHRSWVQAYGSSLGRERLHAVAMSEEDAFVVAVGVASPGSKLVEMSWPAGNGESALIVLVDPIDGIIRRSAVADRLVGALSGSAEAVAVKSINGSEKALLCGSVTIDINSKRNSAAFSFALPNLTQEAATFVRSSRMELFTGAATSINDHSLYCTGSTTVSMYEETDARVVRFNIDGLDQGWFVSIGSIRFPSMVNIKAGEATERGRDIAVDENGNIYVLVQSTSRLSAFDEISNQSIIPDEMTNMRAALTVLAPNGSFIDITQSLVKDEVTVSTMALVGSVVVFAGHVLDEEFQLTQAVLSATAIKQTTQMIHGLEFVPVNNNSNGTGDGEESLGTFEIPAWLVLTAVVGGIIFAVMFFTTIAMIVRNSLRLQ